MFESVIVPVDASDGSARALPVAAALARETGTHVDLFAVTSASDDAATGRWLDDLAATVGAPIGLRQVVTAGSVVDAITEEQRARPRSLVCMATSAHTGPAELLLGGHAGDLLRGATRPILLVGPRARTPRAFDVVQVCVDDSEDALAVLAAAESFARRTRGHLCVVQVVSKHGRGDPSGLRAAVDRIHAETDVFVEWEVLHARDVPSALVEHARRLPASIVALATHGRTNPVGKLLGSVALRVTHTCPVPVLVVRAR